MPVRLTAESTLTVGVNVCLNGCLSFSVSLAFHPMTGDRLEPNCNSELNKLKKINAWLNG